MPLTDPDPAKRTGRLDRLLRPRSIAVVGGGVWCANVIAECRKIGFDGTLWPVHPHRAELGGLPAYGTVADLPGVPDATFLGVNRGATVALVRELSTMGGGGAVCFASGFGEAAGELSDSADLQAALVTAAGAMPILGPNCYGFINALDGAALWPDQHGALRVDRGVALITQSSNIAINLTMQRRGLPLAYVVTAGNQAQTDLAELGQALLSDDRVTALGLHIEGIRDLRTFEGLAQTARALGKPIVALKIGASDQAQQAAVSHTASIAGSDAGARALLRRLGIGQVRSLGALLETLKILHVTGPLSSNRIASLSCSGGEAGLMADAAMGHDVIFPSLGPAQETALREALGPKVALANPLDYHTYIWGNRAALAQTFTAMMTPDLGFGCVVLDFPRPDRCDGREWDKVIDAVAVAQTVSGVPMAILSSLPDTLPEATAAQVLARGIVPLSGISDALEAIAVAASLGPMPTRPAPLLLPGADMPARILTEAEAKAVLSGFGAEVPASARAATPEEAAEVASRLTGPLVLKGEGLAHKTEAGAVLLNLPDADAIADGAHRMQACSYLVEEMIEDGVVELLIGVLRDPAHGFVLTLAAGGVLAELMQDTAQLLLPASETEIDDALSGLPIARVLDGYRGGPQADRAAILRAIGAVQNYAIAHAATLQEIEINPLIATPTRAVVADALIRIGDAE